MIRGAEREGEGDYGRKKDGCCDKDGGCAGILMSKNDRQEAVKRKKWRADWTDRRGKG